MHFSLSKDLTPLRQFLQVLRKEGMTKVTTLMERGNFQGWCGTGDRGVWPYRGPLSSASVAEAVSARTAARRLPISARSRPLASSNRR